MSNPATREAMERIMGAVDRLPPRQRDVMRLRMLGKSHPEIAKELGITIPSSWMRLARARKKLRRDR